MSSNMFKTMISESSQFDREKNYWLNKFSGELIKSNIPYDNKIDGETGYAGDVIPFSVPGELSTKLDHISNRSDKNLFVVLAAGLTLLLNRYTGNDDIVYGIPIMRQGTEGDYINVVIALRKQLRPEMTLKELLVQAKQAFKEGNDHSNYPIERLEYYLGMENPAKGHNLFETIILLQNIHEPAYIKKLNHNMVFHFNRQDGVIEGQLEYNGNLYRRETAEAAAANLMNIMQNMLADLNKPLTAIELLSETERRQLLEEFNDTDANPQEEKLYHQLFEDRVRKHPENRAVVSVQDGLQEGIEEEVELTYAALNEKSNRLARRLRQKGVGRDSIVAIIVKPSLEMAIGIMAVIKAGGAYLPIDHESPAERVEYLLKESHSRTLLTQDTAAVHSGFEGETVDLQDQAIYNVNDENNGEDGEASAHTDLEPVNEPGDLFYTIYTSGTTGRPKGVLLTHRNLVNYVAWFTKFAELNENDRTILTSSYAFDLGYSLFLGSLASGGELHLTPKETYINVEKLLDYIYEKELTYLKMTPSLFSIIVNNMYYTPESTARLRKVILGGEAINTGDLEKARQKCSHINFINHYGPTETTIGTVARHIPLDNPEDIEAYKETPTIGKPIDNARAYILDRHLRLLPMNVPGELYIGGKGVARGYLNLPELTGAKFVPNPYVEGDTIYGTGDMARWHHTGNIEFLGRKDNQVKIRGYRIELGEIEARILEHQDIKDVVVQARDDRGTGKYLCAYIVPQTATTGTGDTIDTKKLREDLSENLPEYMMPTYFAVLAEIPLNPNGKVDKKALPVPEARQVSDYIAPQTETEKKLAELWSNSLSMDKDTISSDASFFDLGGHSLSAAILIAKIHEEFDVKIPLVRVFEKPGLNEMAEFIESENKDVFTAIPQAEPKEYYPLSSAQNRLHFLQQLELNSTAYNITQVFEIEGELDRERLEDTFKQLLRRHESLRTSFEVVGNEAIQRIHPDVDFTLEYHDLEEQGQGRDDIPAQVARFVRPFDLTAAPLFRAGVAKVSAQHHILMVDLHHIISDGISHRVLIEDFGALSSGMQLPELRIQYKDYAQWQQSPEAKQILARQEHYWLKEFEGEIPVINLPADNPRPAVQSFEGGHHIFSIDAEETKIIKEMAGKQGATQFMVMLAVYNVFLSKLTNQDDIVVGTPIAGRSHADLEKIIGMFVNTLALRNKIPAQETFSQYLETVKARTLDAFDNQDYKFEDLVEKAEVVRDFSRNPLFDVMFIYQNIRDQGTQTPGEAPQAEEQQAGAMKVRPYGHETGTSKFDLTLFAQEHGDTMFFRFEYAKSLFTPETIEKYAQYFKAVIQSITAAPRKKLGEITILREEEKQRIEKEFNATAVDYPKDSTIHEQFTGQAARTPEAIAVTGVSAQQPEQEAPEREPAKFSLTYRELDQRSNRLARHLQTNGVKPGQQVGIIVRRSVDMIAGLLAILKTGAAYIPLDPTFPLQRLIHIMEDSKTDTLLTAGDYSSEYNLDRAEGLTVVEIDDPAINDLDSSAIEKAGSPTDLAYIIYTSGSTGKPKGVMIEHRALSNFIKGITDIIDIAENDTILSLTTISFDIFGLETLLPLTVGARVVMGTEREQTDPEAAAKVIEEESINTLQLTPSRLQMLLMHPESAARLKQLKTLMVGGEALPQPLLDRAREVVEGKIYNMYGPTETTIWSTVKDVGKGQDLNIGKPIANTTIYILDGNRNQQPIGISGELWISGDGLARGYYNNEALTAERFIENPYEPGERLYNTGDIARWLPDGNIEYQGRKDHQVKIRGFRIELGEIEAQLKTHPAVDEAVVVCRQEQNGDKNICAYIVNREGGIETLDTASIRAHLTNVLPGYMIPAYIIPLEQIPLTPNGKIDRNAMPAPEVKSEVEYVAPRNDTEIKLVEIWSDLLGIEKEKIGIDANYFQMGGHSLNATVMVVRIHKEIGVRIQLAEMFKTPTIRGINTLIEVIGWATEKPQPQAAADMEEILI